MQLRVFGYPWSSHETFPIWQLKVLTALSLTTGSNVLFYQTCPFTKPPDSDRLSHRYQIYASTFPIRFRSKYLYLAWCCGPGCTLQLILPWAWDTLRYNCKYFGDGYPLVSVNVCASTYHKITKQVSLYYCWSYFTEWCKSTTCEIWHKAWPALRSWVMKRIHQICARTVHTVRSRFSVVAAPYELPAISGSLSLAHSCFLPH